MSTHALRSPSSGLPRSAASEPAHLVVLPEVEAPSLEGLSVTLPAPRGFSAEQVQERFLELARAHATERYRYPGEQISWGDEVLLDLAGYSQGRLMPFSLRTEVWLSVRAEPLLPGLYEALVGRSPGEGLAVDLTVPESYPVESLRGIPARFVVHIRAARQVTYPDLESAGFLQAFGRGGTLREAMHGVVRQMEDEADAAGLTLEAVADALRTEPEQLARIDQVAWHLMTVDHVMSRASIHIEAS